MFKFDLEQTIYYMRENRIHSAPVLARMIVENLKEEWANTNEQKRLFTPFGVACECYSTCHGLIQVDEAFGSKQDLVASLLSD
jgi:hypothetical protein